MLSRWLGSLAAAVALVAGVLLILDVTDAGLRRWWDDHALTTDTIEGLLVLMITVLVVDQVVRLRQGISRARAVAVQAAILMTQANGAAQAASQMLAGTGDRDTAYEELCGSFEWVDVGFGYERAARGVAATGRGAARGRGASGSR